MGNGCRVLSSGVYLERVPLFLFDTASTLGLKKSYLHVKPVCRHNVCSMLPSCCYSRRWVYIQTSIIANQRLLQTFPTENCTWEYQFGECSKSCGGGERVRYPVVTTPAKAGGFCPELVRNNKTEEEECNPQPCRKPNHLCVMLIETL